MGTEERLRAAFDAFSRRDVVALRDLLAPDAEWLHWDPGPWDRYGRDAILKRMRERMDEGFAGELTEVREAPGDRAYVRIASGPGGVCMAITLRDGAIVRIQDHPWQELAQIDAGLFEHQPPRPARLVLNTDDLVGLRDRLVAAGLRPSPINDGSPGPRYELRITDPDGYVLMIAQRLG